MAETWRDGSLRIDILGTASIGRQFVYGVRWDGPREDRRFDPCNGFRAEAEPFGAMVRGGPATWNGIGEAESIEVMQMLDAVIASARDGGRPVAP